jgi:hypothetical protein
MSATTVSALAELATAIIAVVAVGVSLSSLARAKAAVRVAEAQEDRLTARLALYLKESRSWMAAPTGDRVVGVNVLIVNKSDRSTAITRASLSVSYSIRGERFDTFVEAETTERSNAMPMISMPKALTANDASAGWFTFLLLERMFGGSAIDTFSFVVEDSRGVSERLDSLAIGIRGTE